MWKLIKVIIPVCILLFLSCKKNGFATLEGNVFEVGTNVPIPNAYVRINKYSSYYSSAPFKSATTDANGHFKLKYFKSPLGYDFFLDVISGEHKSSFKNPVDYRKMSTNISLSPFSWIKIRLKNNTLTDAFVYVTIGEELGNSATRKISANKDSTFSYTYKGKVNMPTKVDWYYSLAPNYIKSNVVNDSVVVTNKFDTLVYLIQLN